MKVGEHNKRINTRCARWGQKHVGSCASLEIVAHVFLPVMRVLYARTKFMKLLNRLVEKKINRHSLKFKVWYRFFAALFGGIAFYAGHIRNIELLAFSVFGLIVLWVVINIYNSNPQK